MYIVYVYAFVNMYVPYVVVKDLVLNLYLCIYTTKLVKHRDIGTLVHLIGKALYHAKISTTKWAILVTLLCSSYVFISLPLLIVTLWNMH